MLYVTQDIVDWYTEHSYDLEFGTTLNYAQQSAKYVEAWRFYAMYFKKYQAYKMEKETKHKKTGDALDSMAAGLMAQKRNANG